MCWTRWRPSTVGAPPGSPSTCCPPTRTRPPEGRPVLCRPAGALRPLHAAVLAASRFTSRLSAVRVHGHREKVAVVANIVIFGAGDIARLAHFYFSTDSDHTVVAFTVDATYRTSETFQGLPLVPFDQVALIYPPSDYKMFVAMSYAKMNQVRADEVQRGQGARLRARQLREQPLLVPHAVSARRQLFHPRGQHGTAVRATGQQRDALERQPHRARLDVSAITVSSARTSSSPGTSRSAAIASSA